MYANLGTRCAYLCENLLACLPTHLLYAYVLNLVGNLTKEHVKLVANLAKRNRPAPLGPPGCLLAMPLAKELVKFATDT